MTQTLARRTRTPREPVPVSALTVEGDVDPAQVPTNHGSRQRKWRALAEQIMSFSQQGRWLVVTLQAGYQPDVVRSGLKEELKRSHHRLEWRMTRNGNDTTTFYFSCKDMTNVTT
jgi:hypothetical protein